MTEKRNQPYHRINLAETLLNAAEAELTEHGIERFSLRGVARRAEVSHAAPAHHFVDANGVLTALAARGYARLLHEQRTIQAQRPKEPRAQLIAAGLGYIKFAQANPALFRLMFSSSRPDYQMGELGRTAQSTFDHLVDSVAQLSEPPGSKPSRVAIMAVWSIAHGLADLLVAGHSATLTALVSAKGDDGLEAVLSAAIPHSFPPEP